MALDYEYAVFDLCQNRDNHGPHEHTLVALVAQNGVLEAFAQTAWCFGRAADLPDRTGGPS